MTTPEDAAVPVATPEPAPPPATRRSWRRWLLWGYAGLLTVLLVAVGIRGWLVERQLRNAVQELVFDVTSIADGLASDHLVLEVGKIQFMRCGFSITLDAVDYSQVGVSLKGRLGNPTLLNLSNVTLDFSVYQPESVQQMQRRIGNRLSSTVAVSGSNFGTSDGPSAIGQAQSSPIASLLLGQQEKFEVTIPNVKQSTDNSLDVRVRLSGEGYGYPTYTGGIY